MLSTRGGWLVIDCHIRLAEFSLVYAGSFASSPNADCVRFSSFPYQIVVYVYVLLLSKIENQTSRLFSDCVMFPQFSL